MPTYKQNPSPEHQYDLTITVANAPGPFAVVRGVMQYQITNRDCLPPADFVSGVQKTPVSTSLPIMLKKVNETTYQGRVALDGLVDGDYFGHGICHFTPTASSVQLQATGAAGETRFYATVYADEMTNGFQKTTYYWGGGYPKDKKLDNYPDDGNSSPEEFQEALRADLFSISITARTAQQ